jgi:hypothetical protein
VSSATKTWTFDSDSQGWVPETGSIEVLAFEPSLGNPSGCLSNTQKGKGQTGVDGWDFDGTWESIFGIPPGSVVSSILVQGDGYETKCDKFDHAVASVAGPVFLLVSGSLNVLTLVPGRSYSAVDSSWVSQSPTQFGQPIPAAAQPSNTPIRLSLGATVKTGDRITAINRLLQDNLTITISYN